LASTSRNETNWLKVAPANGDHVSHPKKVLGTKGFPMFSKVFQGFQGFQGFPMFSNVSNVFFGRIESSWFSI
jgi:hypothetical protein